MRWQARVNRLCCSIPNSAKQRRGGARSERVRQQASGIAVAPEALGHQDFIRPAQKFHATRIGGGIAQSLLHQGDRFQRLLIILDFLLNSGNTHQHRGVSGVLSHE